MNSSLLNYFAFLTLKEMLNLFPKEMEGCDGGHITMLRIGDSGYKLSIPVRLNIHDIPEDVSKLFQEGSMEKAMRLHRAAGKRKHVSSYQSRNPEKNKYGGAILAKGKWVISFSGITEKVDELIAIRVACRLKVMDENRMNEIFAISGNSLSDSSVLA